jgi:hypothetical protein
MFVSLASCAGSSFEDANASGTGGAAPSTNADTGVGGVTPSNEAAVVSDVVSPGDTSSPDDRDATTSAPDATEESVAIPDAGVDAPVEALVDARLDHVNDVVSIVDVKTDVPVFADADTGVDVKPSNDASDAPSTVDTGVDVKPSDGATDAVTEEASKPDCLTTGVRVRWVADSSRTVVQANAAFSVYSPAPTQGICVAADDRDPAPNVFDCCFSTTSPGHGVQILFDFVDANNVHACSSTGCGSLTNYTVWVNGQICGLAVNLLQSCMDSWCSWYVQCTTP